MSLARNIVLGAFAILCLVAAANVVTNKPRTAISTVCMLLGRSA